MRDIGMDGYAIEKVEVPVKGRMAGQGPDLCDLQAGSCGGDQRIGIRLSQCSAPSHRRHQGKKGWRGVLASECG